MISVVVPVYKVEQYLDKCVQSILAQTYKDFELILVDDGSPDNCPKMCDDYKNQDSRVRVLHKKNGGLSDARNAGTAVAKGDYITYIDSDDYVSGDYLKTLISLIKDNNADIAVTGIELFSEEKEPSKSNTSKVYIYSKEEALEKMFYQDTLDTSACAMLLPIEIAKNYPFPVGKYHEDDFTTYKFYSAVNKVVVTTCKQYFYLQRNGSIMHVFGQGSMDELDAADGLVLFCKESYPQLVCAAESKKFSDYCQVLLSNNDIKQDYPQEYARITDYLKTKRLQILLDKRCRRKNRMAAFVLLMGVEMLKFVNDIRK